MEHELLPILGRALAEATRIVDLAAEWDWTAPTPCKEWDVGRLAAHLVSGIAAFADVGEGKDMDPEEPLLEPEEISIAFDRAGTRAMDAWSVPGALNRMYEPPWGTTPGVAIAGFMLIETVVHSWDLATAIGVPAEFDDEVVEEAFRLALAYADETVRIPEMFGPEVPVPANAPTLDRLVGFLGRQP
jgi:uncharacterized protein (TIGR03086 family)